MEERLADRLIQVGLRTINDHHREQFKRFVVETVEAGRCSQPLCFDVETPVYISMDIDALDPAFAPGVSHREPVVAAKLVKEIGGMMVKLHRQ
jgi:arginase